MIKQVKIFYQKNVILAILCAIYCAPVMAADTDAVITNKSSQFDSVLSETGANITSGGADDTLIRMIRAQRAALDASDALNTVQTKQTAGGSTCDRALRECMTNKCGKNFTKCLGDGDTTWGDKVDACRHDTTCTGGEYAKLTPEIKADRDFYAKMASYNAVIDCGNHYNSCIEEQCGTTFNKCLGKAAGDAAIAKCAPIAKECTKQDSGLAARTVNVFGTLRQNAEKKVSEDMKRLTAMRDEMRSICSRLGATLDERSFNCVFSVEFWAGEGTEHPYASKKVYAGNTFDCTPDWFGVDVTTFKENAQRATRAQEAASSAMLGAGLGVAAGALSSGAIDRAIDTKKAKDEMDAAECEESGGTWGGTMTGCIDKETAEKREARKEERQDKQNERNQQRQDKKDQRQAERAKKQSDRQNTRNNKK